MSQKAIRSLKSLRAHQLVASGNDAELQQVVDHFAVAITPTMHKQIDTSNPNDPIAKQFVPHIDELQHTPVERSDPIGDEAHIAVKGIIHRYPDRCLFTPIHVCAVYCRFCFRKEKLAKGTVTLTPSELETAFTYVQNHPEIWEVIFSGGDPFLLKPNLLQSYLQRLKMIEHVEVIRFHTRVPLVDPKRITPTFIATLQQSKTTYVILHANHPHEFTPESIFACAQLVDAGIPLLSQTTLLKGINDDINTLSQLMRCFIKNRIKPYYLHHADLVRGTVHFRTSIAEGQHLIKQLRGRFSGLCQPTYVLDIPGGYGKIPIGPNYLQLSTTPSAELQYILEDPFGNRHGYPLSKTSSL